MISFFFDYATPSAFESDRERARLGFTADARRPVRLHARIVREALSVRLALQALGELIWSNDSWIPDGGDFLLDPIVTVHPDRVFFEAFSQDQSAYGLVVLDRAIFAPEGEVICGTTNVDFTSWLWAALAEMRSRRETWFRIGAEGFEVRTEQAGGRFERKVDNIRRLYQDSPGFFDEGRAFHWLEWLNLADQGRLVEVYESNVVDADRLAQLCMTGEVRSAAELLATRRQWRTPSA